MNKRFNLLLLVLTITAVLFSGEKPFTKDLANTNSYSISNIQFSGNVLEEMKPFTISYDISTPVFIDDDSLNVNIYLNDEIFVSTFVTILSSNSIHKENEFIVPILEENIVNIRIEAISLSGRNIIFNETYTFEVRHASSPPKQVHQFFAGEGAKIWPGWEGTKYTYTVTINQITFHNANVDILSNEEIYFKYIVNDIWNINTNNSNYFQLNSGNDCVLTNLNIQIEKQLNAYEPLVIIIIGAEKDGDLGSAGNNDNNLGKQYIVITDHENFSNLNNQTFPCSSCDYNISFPENPGENDSYISVGLTLYKVEQGVNLIDDTRTQAQTELNSYIGTRLVYDTYNTDPWINNYDKFVATYTGKNIDGLININQGTILDDASNVYAFEGTVPYSNFDSDVYDIDENTHYVTDQNDDIIEGTHEEDTYYPDYVPDNIWDDTPGGVNAPFENLFQDDRLHLHTGDFFQNHFWEPDAFLGSSFNLGGCPISAIEIGDNSSAYYKGQLYWDYYVIPLYYGKTIEGVDLSGDQTTIDKSYYFLGRVLHLFEDLSSLPHTHRDAHPFDDYFESEVGDEYISGDDSGFPEIRWEYTNSNQCIDFNAQDGYKYIDGSDYQYGTTYEHNNITFTNALDEWNNPYDVPYNNDPLYFGDYQDFNWPDQSDWNNTKIEEWQKRTPLFYLFYSLAELTDNYPSDNADGDFYPEGFNWINNEENFNLAADDIMPNLINHIAGLYKLFWVSTHFPTEITQIDQINTYSGYLEDDHPGIADAMKASYVQGYNVGKYIGSPKADCLVNEYGNGSYYRSFNHGGLFYNSSTTQSYYIGEGIWNSYLPYLNLGPDNNQLGMPISNEYQNQEGNPQVNFEYGKITWLNGSPIIAINSNTIVDVALVLDRSGSMDGNKIVQAKNAGAQFVNLLVAGDELAVCSYSSSATTNFSMTEIIGQETLDAAINAINGISAGGRTSIGGGMQEGQGQLYSASNADYPQNMLLLSDGIENEPPYVYEVLPTIPTETRIFTLGFGGDADEQLMTDIATQTGGFYRYIYYDGSNISLIVNDILNFIKGQNVFATFKGSIGDGREEIQQFTLPIDSLTSQTTFSLLWEHANSDLDFTLIDPVGITVDSSYASLDSTIQFSSFATQEYYNIDQPLPGSWTINVIGVSVPYDAENYFVTVSGMSGINLAVNFNSDIYCPNQAIGVNAIVTEYGLPVTGSVINLLSETPSLQLDTLLMLDDGLHGDIGANDGVYGAYFNNTAEIGNYTVTIIAEGNTENGGDYYRTESRTTVVSDNQNCSIFGCTDPTAINFDPAATEDDGSCQYSLVLYSGWNQVTVPYVMDPCDPASIFGDFIDPFYDHNLATSNIASWSEGSSSYYIPDCILPGDGFWLRPQMDSTVVTLTGDVYPEMEKTWTLTKQDGNYWYTGWHMIGNPFINIIDFTTAVLSDVDNIYYVWNPVTHNYEFFPSGGMTQFIYPWEAVWVHAAVDGGQITLNRGATLSKTDAVSFVPTWGGTLSAAASEERSEVYFGVTESATDGFDGLPIDVPKVDFPMPPGISAPVSLAFEMQTVDEFSGKYVRDYRSPDQSFYSWPLTVSYSLVSEQISLTLSGIDGIPSEYDILLYSENSSDLLADLRTAEYSFQFTEDQNDEGIPPFGGECYSQNFLLVVTNDLASSIPEEYYLSQNYPNPFNNSTTINFGLVQESDVKIEIYNVLGQKVDTIINKRLQAGNYTQNIEFSKAASGIYFCHMIAGGSEKIIKMLYVK